MSDATTARHRRRRSSRSSVAAYTIPTDAPEADGTLDLGLDDDRRRRGRGGRRARARLHLRRRVDRRADPTTARRGGRAALDALAPRRAWAAMVSARSATSAAPASASMAISAVDVALWDLKARLLELPLVRAARRRRASGVPVYGSGGFTSYSDRALAEQLAGWVERGHPAGEDEGRAPSRPRTPRPRGGGARGDRRRRASCSSTPTAPTRRKQALRAGRALRRART